VRTGPACASLHSALTVDASATRLRRGCFRGCFGNNSSTRFFLGQTETWVDIEIYGDGNLVAPDPPEGVLVQAATAKGPASAVTQYVVPVH